jgi:hypothetical protein
MEYHHKLKLAEVDVFADEVVFSGVKGVYIYFATFDSILSTVPL